ncbi:hypothetical protein [Veronia pacifica]|uniref:VOC domain-containing protein n=1 Tax=Veronia pacifica TaxID=1080227 RepID=A0A1C3EAM0_9GAMM|nr:hypothetical protein [Veronia pacifica]ODA30295.1 hypothetical protein A8L45_20410 [Veronia pacifica]
MIKYIEVHVNDIDKSRHFWSWFLDEVGYCPLANWEHGFSYSLGESYLSFVQSDKHQKPEVFHPTLKKLKHLPFGASSSKDIQNMADALMYRGIGLDLIKQSEESAIHKEHSLWFTDLNGINVEFSTAA